MPYVINTMNGTVSFVFNTELRYSYFQSPLMESKEEGELRDRIEKEIDFIANSKTFKLADVESQELVRNCEFYNTLEKILIDPNDTTLGFSLDTIIGKLFSMDKQGFNILISRNSNFNLYINEVITAMSHCKRLYVRRREAEIWDKIVKCIPIIQTLVEESQDSNDHIARQTIPGSSSIGYNPDGPCSNSSIAYNVKSNYETMIYLVLVSKLYYPYFTFVKEQLAIVDKIIAGSSNNVYVNVYHSTFDESMHMSLCEKIVDFIMHNTPLFSDSPFRNIKAHIGMAMVNEFHKVSLNHTNKEKFEKDFMDCLINTFKL